MGKQIRYTGEFLSRKGAVWRVDILQEADSAFSVSELTFPADSPLVIEWGNLSKEETVCGSTATLRIESPGDRTYEDLYTIAPGRIGMNVYRDGNLYWSGTLDPEFYEEPYEKASMYDVALTFSDFGILDRFNYDMEGLRTVREVVGRCMERAGLASVLDETLISTSVEEDGAPMSLADLKVRSDNFYDEDGEASTLKDALEGILRPLALRIVQRAGRIYVHDFNALYTTEPVPVEWDGDSQTLGTDKVFNNARITWSTYAQSGELSESECFTVPTDPNAVALDNEYGRPQGDAVIFSYHSTNDFENYTDNADAGFTLWVSAKGENAEITDTRARFYSIVPQYSGQESEGIAVAWPGVRLSVDITPLPLGNLQKVLTDVVMGKYGVPSSDLAGTTSTASGPVFRSRPVAIPHVNDPDGLLVRLALETLMDPRINPFEEAENAAWVKMKDWQENWNRRGNFVYIPVRVMFRPYGSDDRYYWSNRDVVTQDVSNDKAVFLSWTYGNWTKASAGNEPWGYLCYYDPADRAEKSGMGGWKTNRHAINPHTGKLSVALAEAKDGQFISYPNNGAGGGELCVEVLGKGWIISDGNTNLSAAEIIDTRGLWEKYCWILCRLPQIEIVNNRPFDSEIDGDDVEYTAVINPDAKEDIEIDTVCGSSAKGVPMARGAYFRSKDGAQVTALTRGGRTSQVEDLLIGTLFSQFGQRRTTLSGEMCIASGGWASYSEANQDGKKFTITSDTQDIIADISEATVAELRPDEYEKDN